MSIDTAIDIPDIASPPSLPLLLFAIPELAEGGPDRVLFELLCHLPRDRFRLALAVGARGGRYFDMLPPDVAIIETGGGRYPIRGLTRAIDTLRPVLLFTTLRMNLTAPLALSLSHHRPILVARQANAIARDFAILKRQSLFKHRLAEQVTRFALRRAHALVAQSHDMADELRHLVRPKQMLVTIGNPVDLGTMSVLADAQMRIAGESRLPGNPALLSVGRLMPQKGYDLLIEAMPAIRRTHPDAELTIAGEGPERPQLEEQVAALGLSGAVHLIGRSETPLALMKQADLFISASRYEGFPNVLLEAMAVGCTVAATDCPGATSELVIDGETGWLAPRVDAAAIADATCRALSGNRSKVRDAARRHLDESFSRMAVTSSYANLFSQLLRQEKKAA